MNKITILGVRASGKTTLANRLDQLFGIPVVHLDKIFWAQKGGISEELYVQRVEEIIAKNDTWIIEGSSPQSKTLDIRIAHADIIIFFHLPLYIVLWRQTKRFLRYFNRVRPDLGGDNKGEPFPFRWKEIQHARQYPNQELYSKILPYQASKTVIIIRTLRDEKRVLQEMHSLFPRSIEQL